MDIKYSDFLPMAKRTTTEEKIHKIADFLKSKSEIYTGKELEKKLPTAADIPSIKVMEFLKMAVDDNFICCEKLGLSNIYWKFKNESKHRYICSIEKKELEIESYAQRLEYLEKSISNIAFKQEETPERKSLLERYRRLKKKEKNLENKKEYETKYSKKAYDITIESISKFKEDINRIVDSIYDIQGYFSKKYSMEKKEISKALNIPDGLDYI